MRLSDKTGVITGMLWNASEDHANRFDNGDYVRIQGKAQFYNGAMQIIVQKVSRADASQVDTADFENLGTADIESLANRLSEILREIKNFHLRNLAECFLIDDAFMQLFQAAPAGDQKPPCVPRWPASTHVIIDGTGPGSPRLAMKDWTKT